MNWKRTLTMVGTLGIVGQALAVNILTNPGFETGDMTGWTTTMFTATNNDAHTGSWSTIDFGNFSVEQSFAPVSGADVDEVSVWVKQPDRSSFFFAFELLYSDSSVGGGGGFGGTTTTTWTKFDFTSLVDTSKSLSGIRAWGYTSGGTNDVTWYDDFVVDVDAVPEPASMAVLGFGAIAMLRRRKK